MARIAETFNFGAYEDMDSTELLRQLERMYTNLAIAINAKPDLYQRDTDGQPTDTALAQGSININISSIPPKVEMLTQHLSPILVTWTTLS